MSPTEPVDLTPAGRLEPEGLVPREVSARTAPGSTRPPATRREAAWRAGWPRRSPRAAPRSRSASPSAPPSSLYLFWNVDINEIGARLAKTLWGFLAASIVLNIASLWLRAWRWYYLFPPGSHPPISSTR